MLLIVYLFVLLSMKRLFVCMAGYHLNCPALNKYIVL